MEIILIKPKRSNFYEKTGSQILPLGIADIASVLRKNGHYVVLHNLEIDKKLNVNE